MDSANHNSEPRPKTVTTWSVGVTTAPRAKPTLDLCLQSLARAGWERPRLFAEPDVEIPMEFRQLPITRRDEVIGAFPNWYLALAELVMRQPRAEAYFLIQDDVIFANSIRSFLEVELWPSLDTGVVSIYCPSHYAKGKPAGFHLEDNGWRNWIAQALIIPNPCARGMVASPLFSNHRHHGPREGSRNIDNVVGGWCETNSRHFYVFTPSLAEHIGVTSTLYPYATATGRRRASTFVGESFNVSNELHLP